MKTSTKNKPLRIILLIILAAIIAAGMIHSRFGGFGTGPCADPEAFRSAAGQCSELSVPAGTRIVGLGEATHGNKEFQQLKADVFRHLAEDYGVRCFALEGDFGGCEAVNRYIHGGEGTAQEAAAAIGFFIYRTEEMEQLITWMRDYNKTAAEGEDLRFCGFDSQRIAWSRKYLLEAAQGYQLDTADLEQLCASADPEQTFGREEDRAVILNVREQLVQWKTEDSADPALDKAIHYADSLLQNIELGTLFRNNDVSANGVRDEQMKENVLWILEQEEQRGNEMIFICGHNGHIRQRGQYGPDQNVMGALLNKELGSGYFAIGTDFFKATDNLPTDSRKRVTRTFYSYDPLAKAAYKCGYDSAWLDFASVPEDSPLREYTGGNIFMGLIGEVPADGLSGIILRLLPQAYRIKDCPEKLYDGMIFVSEARPVVIRES